MADHPVQFIQCFAGFFQHSVQTSGQSIHCKAEHRFAIHRDGGRAFAAGPAGVNGGIAPGTQCYGKGHGGCSQLKDGCTGPIAKQYAGGTVGGVYQAGESFTAHHKGIPPAHRCQQPACHGGTIQKAGAGRVHVQRRAVFRQAQRCLDLAGNAGGRIRCRKGGTDAAADVCRGKAAAAERLLCCSNGKGGSGFVLAAPVPGTDAGAGGDPLVAGVHHAAQIFVRDSPAGQCPAGGYQAQSSVHGFLVSPI